MSATITLAKEEASNLIQHINDVEKEKALLYRCVGCGKEMIIVKSKPRKKEWHFRHTVESTWTGGRDTALHDYAVQVLMAANEITLTKDLNIGYTNSRKEVFVMSKRSDVTATYQNEDVHFEVFVTHDLDQEKIDIYKNNKIKCLRINLSDQYWLSTSPETIKDAVLNQHKTKSTIYWTDEPIKIGQEKRDPFNLGNFLLSIIATIGIAYLFRKFFLRRKNR